MEAVTAAAAADVSKRLLQTVLPVEPVAGPAECRQIFLLVAQRVRREGRVGHRGALHGLLIVGSLVLPVAIPTGVPDRPEDILGRGSTVEEGECFFRHFTEGLLRPAPRSK